MSESIRWTISNSDTPKAREIISRPHNIFFTLGESRSFSVCSRLFFVATRVKWLKMTTLIYKNAVLTCRACGFCECRRTKSERKNQRSRMLWRMTTPCTVRQIGFAAGAKGGVRQRKRVMHNRHNKCCASDITGAVRQGY